MMMRLMKKNTLLDVNQSNGTNLDSESKLSSRQAAGWHNGLFKKKITYVITYSIPNPKLIAPSNYQSNL
jgi:hypothetical protein